MISLFCMSRIPKLRRRAGWTMGELLVVISLVGLLVALVFPAMRAVRLSGVQAECAANMRSYGVALLAYAQEHQGLPDRRGSSEGVHYTDLLVPRYLAVHSSASGRRLLHCPVMTEEDRQKVAQVGFGFEYGGNLSLSRYYPTLRGIPAPLHRVVLAAEGYYHRFHDHTHLNATIWGAGADEASDPNRRESAEGRLWTPQYHGRSSQRGLHFFFLDGHVELVCPTDNQWLNEPTYGTPANGGYFYDQRQFHQMSSGQWIVD